MAQHAPDASRSVRRRHSPQRDAVQNLLSQQPGFVSAQALHTALRRSDAQVSLATVYRHLQAMTETGEVDLLHGEDGEVRYRWCSEVHHHHLICRSCGETKEIDAPAIESWAESVAADFAYVDVDHTVEVFGTCRTCASR